MKAFSKLSRRALAGVAAVALSATLTTVVGVQSAGAVSYAGQLGGHGLGTVFARSGQILTEAVASAGTATYTFEVVNTDNVPAQFLVHVSHSGTAVVTVKAAAVDVTYSAMNDGWFTNVIPANKLQTFTVAFKVPVGSAPYEDDSTVSLDATNGSQLGALYLATYIKAPIKGTGPADLFIKGTNGQFIGGPSIYQIACSTVLKGGQHTVFTVQIQNDTTAPSQPVVSFLDAQGNRPAFPLKVVYAGIDQTNVAFGSAWVSPVLKPGTHVILTVTASSTAANSQGNLYEVDTYDNLSFAFGGTDYIQVNGSL